MTQAPLKTYKFKVYHGEEECKAHSYIGRTVIEAQRLLLLDLILGGIAYERVEIATMPAILESRWRAIDGPLPNLEPLVGYFPPAPAPAPAVTAPGDTDRFFKRANPDGYSNIVRLTEEGALFYRTVFESKITGRVAPMRP